MTPTRQRTFGANAFGVTAAPRSLGKPGAVYPGSVATDSDMIIAVDRQQTRLALPLNTTDVSMTVVDPSMIVAYNLLSIDAEIVKTTGPPVGNVVPISRAFDGTTAAVHLASAVVSGFIDAYHHNRLVAEVEAIQQTLGPNLSNISAIQQIVSSAYNFPAQTPGGNLVVGNNSITLSPVPKGVNGSNLFHYLYISGGTGTAEAVLINGGTAVSGAASGTVIVNCASTHSGAWTIKTATAGIQEAVNFLGSAGGTVVIPVGTNTVYATTTVRYNGITIVGASQNAVIVSNQVTGDVFFFDGPDSSGGRLFRCHIMNLYCITGVTKTAGAAISLSICDITAISDIWAEGYPIGIKTANCSSLAIDRVYITSLTPLTGVGILVDGGGDIFITDVGASSAITNQAAAGIQILATGGMTITNTDVFGGGHGLLINPSSGGRVVENLFVVNGMFDSCAAQGICVIPSGPGQIVRSLSITNSWSAGNMDTGILLSPSGGASITGVTLNAQRVLRNHGDGISILGNTTNVRVVGGSTIAGNNAALSIAMGTLTNITVSGTVATLNGPFPHGLAAGSTITVSGATVDPDLNGTYTIASVPTGQSLTFPVSAVAGGVYTDAGLSVQSVGLHHGIVIGQNITNCDIRDSYIGQFDGEANTHSYQVYVDTGADKFAIEGNRFTSGLVGVINNNSAGTNRSITGNGGIDFTSVPVVAAASIAVGVSSAFTITGATTVSSFTGSLAVARRIVLVKPDAGTVQLGNGAGNIGGTFSLAQFGAVEYWCDGTTWFRLN